MKGTLMREIEEYINKCEDIPVLWIERINIVKMSILPKAIYRFNSIPIKKPIVFITEMEETILKFVWYFKRSWISKVILTEEKKKKKLEASEALTWNKAKVMETVWHKIRHTDKWNRIKSPDMDIQIYDQLIHDKGAKIFNGKRAVS